MTSTATPGAAAEDAVDGAAVAKTPTTKIAAAKGRQCRCQDMRRKAAIHTPAQRRENPTPGARILRARQGVNSPRVTTLQRRCQNCGEAGRSRLPDDASPYRVEDDLGGAVKIQLLHDARAVGLHGARADREQRGDLLVGL